MGGQGSVIMAKSSVPTITRSGNVMGGLEMIRVMGYGTDFSLQSDDVMGGQGMI